MNSPMDFSALLGLANQKCADGKKDSAKFISLKVGSVTSHDATKSSFLILIVKYTDRVFPSKMLIYYRYRVDFLFFSRDASFVRLKLLLVAKNNDVSMQA